MDTLVTPITGGPGEAQGDPPLSQRQGHAHPIGQTWIQSSHGYTSYTRSLEDLVWPRVILPSARDRDMLTL
jgi:hypothetical protein